MNIFVSIGLNFQDTETVIECTQMAEIVHKVEMTTETETNPVTEVMDLDHHTDTELAHVQRAVMVTEDETSGHASIRVFADAMHRMR